MLSISFATSAMQLELVMLVIIKGDHTVRAVGMQPGVISTSDSRDQDDGVGIASVQPNAISTRKMSSERPVCSPA